MIKLTPRLKIISEQILKGETMADIGTDHGFLPVYLWENGISPKVILADVSKGSLDKAKENCMMLYPDFDFDLRLGSGLEVLKDGEVEDVVIAGMGGILMTEILGYNLQKSYSFSKFILQPRNHVGYLRHWLYNNGFSIISERIAPEKKRYCEIITAIKKEKAITRQMGADRIEYEYPLSLIDYSDPLIVPYLSSRCEKEKIILSNMDKSSKVSLQEYRSQKYRIEYLIYLLEHCRRES